MSQTYKIASDFLTGVVSSSSQKLEKKDLFYILTNYKSKNVFSEELLNNPNLFYLFIVHKIPFDLNVLRLLPEKFGAHIKQIEIWDHYLKTGVIMGDLPHIFHNNKPIMVKKLNHGSDMNADSMDVIHYITNKSKYVNKGFYTGGIPLPGMLSYEVHDLPLFIPKKEIEFFDYLIFYAEPHKWVYNNSDLEELKVCSPIDTIIFEASPYITTKREFQLAYVLCRKKLIILKNNYRADEIKSWFAADALQSASRVARAYTQDSQSVLHAQHAQQHVQHAHPVKTVWTSF